MKFFTPLPRSVGEIGMYFLTSFMSILKWTWVWYLGLFWIAYGIETGALEYAQGSALSQAFTLSFFVVWAIWFMIAGSYKVISAVVMGDLKRLLNAFDNFDGLIFGVCLVFVATAFFFPRFLLGIHVALDVIIFYLTAFFSLLFVLYVLVCLTERKLLIPKKWQSRTES